MTIGIYFASCTNFKKYDYYIAAEGGGIFLNQKGIIPNLAVGDFDTVNKEDVKALEFQIHSWDKEYTDIELCLIEALKLTTLDKIEIHGHEIGRLDHFLNQKTMLKKHVGLKINYNHCTMYYKDTSFTLEQTNQYVSFFCEKAEIKTKGMYWDFESKDVEYYESVSNQMGAQKADITVTKGLVLVIETQKK